MKIIGKHMETTQLGLRRLVTQVMMTGCHKKFRKTSFIKLLSNLTICKCKMN